MLQQQKRDYEQALNSVDQLSRRLDTALVVSIIFQNMSQGCHQDFKLPGKYNK